ncbi:preprotein translocase subunit SecG [Chitinophaga ginsengisegetis]|uniref:Protein-export membrane protein SecG n=1 Tax=Chitinophaga ginsengisegetis TaxID=393003 RepID=A0A1T5NEL4_9BACT|nr:preprotein translocase subunit SecG [Chitinophaga ginsengisegetis]MDR6570446.1 preprotein translocase subunit SecG [Chitinophaga ginsengisegetis]MDR6650180.1 preprotein translocase subunit SecG [Chitinophaga ginsengisegetis]MDR6656701.1 preprotein translocase subunit SecG [Chitinophaga ginsengisegetis]SKC98827.1 preprotein translocase subunit SecG [Chitinophaga ginsengisegetis]
MLIIFGILIILACVLLGFFVLIQNPKGGGLSGNLGGVGNQVIGVRQTTDVLEKGTWILAALIAILCLTAPFFIGKGSKVQQVAPSAVEKASAGQPIAPPAQSTPLPGTTPAPAPAPAPNK